MKKVLWLNAALLLLLSVVVAAHGENGEQTVNGYDLHLELSPDIAVTGQPVALRVHVADEKGNPITGQNAELEILRIKYPLTETEQGVYEHTYTFDRFGANEAFFTAGNVSANFDIDVQVGEQNNHYGVIALALILLTAALFVAAAVTKKMQWTSALLYSGIAIVVLGLGYSVFAYNTSPAVQGCVLQVGDQFVLHCHQNVHVNICGEEKGFDWEIGSLNEGAHTHKGDHRIHWHPGLPVADPAALQTLRHLFADLGYQLTENSVQDPKSGTVYRAGEDICGTGTGGVLKVYETPESGNQRTEIADFLDRPLEDEARYDIEYN